ncbi:ATP-dependent DNA helicase DinG [Filobacillus milosensis]|uniref:3'-5' exonuclease DinG n=1 Tax=Filobacillus milosensis TaxID=94137 RepID=A0A4Y8IQY2_9BACI|nr:ATP-dependent DNA helicase DinG [Filobacillus milosensis]TFB23988.1 ATP-dependent DNA helicase DinG [Filobacillus milosensis]
MNRFVVVDLETTGHSPKKGDEIIEIGLVVVENNQIVDEFSTKVKPNREIPPFISHLTGITNEDVADSPSINDIIPILLPYLEDGYFVAHQVQFDYDFLNESLLGNGYGPIECPVLDTVELSRVLFPTADSFKLEDITEHLNIEHFSPHRALSDAYVTALLLLKILNKIDQLPYKTLLQMKPLTLTFKGDVEQIIEDILREKQYQHEHQYDLVEQNGFAVKSIHTNKQSKVTQQNYNDFDEFLNNYINSNILTLRESQIEMAKQIHLTIKNQSRVVIEAGTGIGKTISYLLPALYYANHSNQRVVISTSTIQLQQQMINRDWPLLLSFTKLGQSMTILKSPTHYINLKKFKHFLNSHDSTNYDVALSLSIILVWLTETETGDRDEIQLPSKGDEIWPFISGESSKSDDQRESYFQLAKMQAENSSIIIVNHAFLISEHLYDKSRIPNYECLIIDEAHRFEEYVRNQVGTELDYVSIAHLLNNLSSIINSHLIETTKFSADQFFRAIYQAVLFLHSEKDSLSDTGKIQLSIDTYHLNAIKSGNINQQLNDLILSMEQLKRELEYQSFNDEWKQILKQKNLSELTSIITILKQFFNEKHNEARWIDIDQDGAKNAVQLNLEPIQVNEIINRKIYKSDIPIIFTSATIRTNHSFKSFLEELGLNEDTGSIYLPSPYQYDQQVKVYVPNDFPDIKQSKQEDYAGQVAEYIVALTEELEEKTIVLFTSFEMLRTVYNTIRQINYNQEINILAQGIQTGSREKLKKMFEKSNQSILLGTSSFWEGIDIQGQSVKMIVMVRLPFDTPNHPMFHAKSKQLESKKQNAFYHWMLPQAILRFRQAFGRLIRSENDRGLFVILDQRIMTKNYGKQFLKSIPDVPIIHDRRHKIIEDAKNWLSY